MDPRTQVLRTVYFAIAALAAIGSWVTWFLHPHSSRIVIGALLLTALTALLGYQWNLARVRAGRGR